MVRHPLCRLLFRLLLLLFVVIIKQWRVVVVVVVVLIASTNNKAALKQKSTFDACFRSYSSLLLPARPCAFFFLSRVLISRVHSHTFSHIQQILAMNKNVRGKPTRGIKRSNSRKNFISTGNLGQISPKLGLFDRVVF